MAQEGFRVVQPYDRQSNRLGLFHVPPSYDHSPQTAGYLEIVELLVTAGAHVNAVDNDGDTPLHNGANGSHAGATP